MARREPLVVPLLGAAALAVGAFAPLARVDVYGDVSLFDASELQALLLLAAAAGAVLGALTRSRGWLIAAALGAWAALLFPLLRRWLTPRDESALGQLTEAVRSVASDAAVDVFGELAFDLTHLRWGGFVLLAGCVLLSLAAFRRGR